MGSFKQICVFEHSVMTNFNRTYPAIQKGQGSGFLSESSSWLPACMSEQRGSGENARMRRLAWIFAARIGDKYQIHGAAQISMFLHKKIRCGYSLEWPRWGDSNKYPQHDFMEHCRKLFFNYHQKPSLSISLNYVYIFWREKKTR